MTAIPKIEPVRDRKFLDWLREQPCVVTGAEAPDAVCEPAHIRWHNAGTSRKPPDNAVLPIHWSLHRQYPNGGVSDWLTLVNEYPLFLRWLLLMAAAKLYEDYQRDR